jgi:hypothetical protein
MKFKCLFSPFEFVVSSPGLALSFWAVTELANKKETSTTTISLGIIENLAVVSKGAMRKQMCRVLAVRF